MALATSVTHILNYVQALNIILQPHKRTEFHPIPLMASQGGSYMLVTSHYNLIQLRLMINLALSNTSIATTIGHYLEVAQLYMRKNL